MYATLNFAENSIPLGRIEVNPIEKLNRVSAQSSGDPNLPGFSDIELVDSDQDAGTERKYGCIATVLAVNVWLKICDRHHRCLKKLINMTLAHVAP